MDTLLFVLGILTFIFILFILILYELYRSYIQTTQAKPPPHPAEIDTPFVLLPEEVEEHVQISVQVLEKTSHHLSTLEVYSMKAFLKKTLFNKYMWFIFLPLLVGWMLLAERLEMRTYKAIGSQLESVKQIWGSNLAQPMPSVRYKRFGSDVSTLNRGEIDTSDIQLNLKVDYRKKGLVYYTGYQATFIGKYTLLNPETEKIYLSFIFPYPTQQGEGVLQNVKLLVQGQEDHDDTEYQPDLALWTGVLNPKESLDITVHYHGRGLNQFEYGFEPDRQINNLTMKVDVQGAKELDYAESTMPPTEPVEETFEGKTLTWKLDRALSQFNISVILPDKLNIEKQLFIMTYRAPVFFFFFLVSLGIILRLSQKNTHFTHIAVFSMAYFLFYPFFAYLATYMELMTSFGVAFGSLGILIFNYARALYGFKVALAIFMAYLFYLGITSVAALLPTYTGLILTIEGVFLMGIIMQVLSKYKDFEISELLSFLPFQKNPGLIKGDNHV